MKTSTAKPAKAAPRRARASPRRPAAASTQAADVSFTEHVEAAATPKASMGADLAARGKDLLSAEAGGLATAVVVGIGAALIEVKLIPGLILGAGAILLGKLFPEIGSQVRPAVKGAVRAGFVLTEKLREVMAEASEQAHDLVAEVRHERDAATPAASARAFSKNGSAGNPQAAH